MSWLTRPLVGFDLETTGLDVFGDRPVSYAFIGDEIDEYHLVDPGIPIPSQATKIHGITNEQAQADGLSYREAMERISRRLQQCSENGYVIVGMNLQYDFSLTETCCRELGLPTPSHLEPFVADVLVIDRHFDPFRSGSRRLGYLCEHYGVKLDGAHNSRVDALASLEVVKAQAERYPALASLEPDELVECQREWHQTWLANYRKWCDRNGQRQPTLGEDSWPVRILPTEPAADRKVRQQRPDPLTLVMRYFPGSVIEDL